MVIEDIGAVPTVLFHLHDSISVTILERKSTWMTRTQPRLEESTNIYEQHSRALIVMSAPC